MKKLLGIFTAVYMIFGMGAFAQNAPDTYIDNTLEWMLTDSIMLLSSNETVTDEQGLIYELTSSGAVVSGYTEDIVSDIEIPPIVYDSENHLYQVTAIKDCAFQISTDNSDNACRIKSVKIGRNVKTIGNLAFDGCSSLETVEIDGSQLTGIGNTPFRNCPNLAEINVTQENDIFCSINGVLYGKAKDFTDSNSLKTALISYPPAKADESYTVADGTELIAIWSFDECKNLKAVTVPSSVKTIDGYAFDGCSSLETVNLSEGLTELSDGAFQYCSSMKTINLPKSLKNIGKRPFFVCDSMETVTVAEGSIYFTVDDGILYTYDKTELVYYPPMLSAKECIIPEGVKIIRSGAFFRAYNIEKLVLPDSAETIEEYGIRTCTSMTECVLSSGLTYMGKECLSYCSALTEITVPDGVESIPDGAFLKCSSLTTVNIPYSVTYISSTAFKNCGDVNICGEDGSYAAAYAQENSYEFTASAVRIKFVTGSDTVIEDKVYDPDTVMPAPESPVKMYFSFAGWYTDKECTSEWDFSNRVSSSMTLYAKWTAVPYKIEFKDNIVSAELIDEAPKKIFAASYDKDGRMIDVIMRDAASEISLEGLNTENASEIRAFLWSGLNGVMPLCVSAEK